MRCRRGRGKCKCAPLKYAEERRTISCAAERARSVASGAITSRDIVLELPSSPSLLAIFSFYSPIFLLIFRQRQSSNNPPRQTPPPPPTSRLFSQCRRAIWNFNLRACAHLYTYTGWARRLGPSRAAATRVERHDDSCLFAPFAVCAPSELSGTPPSPAPPIPSTHQECSRFDVEERRKGGEK